MHKNTEPTTEWKIAVKQQTAARIEHRLIDPVTRKPRYGLRSKLVNILLEQWLRENPSGVEDPSITEADLNELLKDTP